MSNSSYFARFLPKKYFQSESTLWTIFADFFKSINFEPKAYLYYEAKFYLVWMGIIVALLCGIVYLHHLRRPAMYMRCYPRFMYGDQVYGTREQVAWMGQRSRLEAHELEARRKLRGNSVNKGN